MVEGGEEAGVGGEEKNEERKTKLGAAGLPIALVGCALFIVSVNSEACLNSEMNLWINTIMVIWHPLWMPLRVFVCSPAALEAGQTFLDLPLAVALDAASGSGFGFELGASSSSSSSLDFVPSCQIICYRLSVGVLFEVDLVI